MTANNPALAVNEQWKKQMLSQGRPVAVVAGEHLLVGRVPTRDRRLLDVLNDGQTDFVHIYDVRLFRKTDNACTAVLRECVVPKGKVDLVLILDQEHEARDKRMNYFIGKGKTPVLLAVSGYEVRGMLHLNRPENSLWALTHQLVHFFAVTEATVSQVVCDAEMLDVSVVIANKDSLALFSLGGEIESETQPPRTESSSGAGLSQTGSLADTAIISSP